MSGVQDWFEVETEESEQGEVLKKAMAESKNKPQIESQTQVKQPKPTEPNSPLKDAVTAVKKGDIELAQDIMNSLSEADKAVVQNLINSRMKADDSIPV